MKFIIATFIASASAFSGTTPVTTPLKYADELKQTAEFISRPGFGLLACDEVRRERSYRATQLRVAPLHASPHSASPSSRCRSSSDIVSAPVSTSSALQNYIVSTPDLHRKRSSSNFISSNTRSQSTKTVGARLESIGMENTEENRMTWRGLLFSTKNLGNYISGAILYDETIFQAHPDGGTQVEKLQSQNIIPGIKVDMGLFPLAGGAPGETVCTGLDG